MGIDISKITKLFEEISCRSNCCREAMMCEFENKDSTPEHSRDDTPTHNKLVGPSAVRIPLGNT